jgi:hypothetical protein
MKAFVGVGKQLLSVAQLQELMTKLRTEPSYYFLRWTHKVSGVIEQQPTDANFPMIEGQMFHSQTELRWKQKNKDCYDVLLLTITGEHPEFLPVDEEWKTQDRDAYIYSTETRFPKNFCSSVDKLTQRYFINAKTATVHFVALTVGKQK